MLRDGLRLLEDRENRREGRSAELRRLVEEGEASGLSEQDGEAFLDALEAKVGTVMHGARNLRAQP